MLAILSRDLAANTVQVLAELQRKIDGHAGYPERVVEADKLWDKKNSRTTHKSAFTAIRNTLSEMCIGPRRCAYCEDSLADEIEHIYPKNLFPQKTFIWENYLFACGPCNGPKSNSYAVFENGVTVEFSRRKNDPVVPPPEGKSALIDPRAENPTNFLELDLGGVSHEGVLLQPTFEYLANEGIGAENEARAEYTIRTLGLNREILRKARANAFGGFRARLREFVEKLERGATEDELKGVWNDLVGTPHLTVFFEMRRQHAWLPEINNLFQRAPEALLWPITK